MNRLNSLFLALFFSLILSSSGCKTMTPSNTANGAEIDSQKCSVCINNFETESNKASTPCGQEICTRCITELIAAAKRTEQYPQFPCPFCREPIGIKRKDNVAKSWFFSPNSIVWPGEVRVQYVGEVLSKSDHGGFSDLKVDFAKVRRGIDSTKGGSFTVRIKNPWFLGTLKGASNTKISLGLMSFHSETAGDVTNRVIFESVTFDKRTAKYAADGTMTITASFRYYGNEFM